MILHCVTLTFLTGTTNNANPALGSSHEIFMTKSNINSYSERENSDNLAGGGHHYLRESVTSQQHL